MADPPPHPEPRASWPLGRPVVILGGFRTPWAKAGTALAAVPAAELARIPAEELLLRLRVPPEAVDEVILGCVAQPADAANIARVVALRLGLPTATPAFTVQRNCASGMEAITQAFDKIRFGLADLVLAGGTESMSQIPLLFSESYQGKAARLYRSKGALAKVGAMARFRPRDLKPVIGLEEGLTDPVCGQNMGDTAENLARELGISRDEQDEYALESHRRALRAQDEGFFQGEIVHVHAPPDYQAVAADSGPRRGQSLEALAKLRPYFDRHMGTVTVGNACPVTDGGCAVLVASEEKAGELGLEPLGWILSYSYRGCPPDRMGLGPAFATPEALDRASLRLEEIDRIELNEAFAAQVIANKLVFESPDFARRELGRSEPIGTLDSARLNVNGGAIALGHPVGATGARLVLTLFRELRRKGLRRGLATLCVGGGQGGAIVVERR
ncbi:MAG: thiolase family protein [Planctomycetes bacterium]|nr:thiolase family protein [Planctomycetota bacterium]